MLITLYYLLIKYLYIYTPLVIVIGSNMKLVYGKKNINALYFVFGIFLEIWSR